MAESSKEAGNVLLKDGHDLFILFQSGSFINIRYMSKSTNKVHSFSSEQKVALRYPQHSATSVQANSCDSCAFCRQAMQLLLSRSHLDRVDVSYCLSRCRFHALKPKKKQLYVACHDILPLHHIPVLFYTLLHNIP